MLSFAAVAKKLTTPKSDTNDQQQQKEKKKVQKAYDRYEKSYAARGKILDSEDEQQLDDKWGNDDDLLSSSDDSAQDERKKASSSSTPNHTSTNHNNNSYDTATTSTDSTKKIQKRTKTPPPPISPNSDGAPPSSKKPATGPSPKGDSNITNSNNADTQHKNGENSTMNKVQYIANSLTNTNTQRFHPVRYNSTNRRQCIRHGNDDKISTPSKDNRSKITNTYTTRLTLKLTLPAANDPTQLVVSTMRLLLRELQQSDSSASLVPWRGRDCHLPPISQAKDFPTILTKIRKFMYKLYMPKKNESTTVYTNINMGHNISFDTIREDMQSWLTEREHGMYYMMLQAEDGKDVGWLLYSTREMDAGALADDISDAIGYSVGLRWKTIDTGSKTINSKIKALAIEASAAVKWSVQRKLKRLYSRTIKNASAYPNGIRMRYVKLKKDSVNAEERSKLDKLRHRQGQFLKDIQSHTSYELLQLDYSNDAGKIPTLRQMIMSLTSARDKNTPIFHCVDMDWQMDGFVFQYGSDMAEEAETTLNVLLPLLKHLYPTADVGSNFTCEAEDRCQGMKWDDTRKMIVDTEGEEDTADIDACETLVGFVFEETAATELEPTRPLPKSHMPNDNDSVSTFRSTLDHLTLRGTPTSIPEETETPATTCSPTDASLSTFTTNTSSLESTLTSLSTQVLQQQAQFNDMQQLLHQLIASQKPSSATEANQKAREVINLSGDEL